MSTLKQLYSLEDYNSNGFSSSLTEWYNSLLDKTVQQLRPEDVTRIIRQKKLFNHNVQFMAVNKIIEFLIENPFAGAEYAYIGQVLFSLTQISDEELANASNLDKLLLALKSSKFSIQSVFTQIDMNWEFFDEEGAKEYTGWINEMIDKLEIIISKQK